MKRMELDGPLRDAMVRALSTYLKREHDLDLAAMEALVLLDFITERLGPLIYNQALADARARLHAKFDALDDVFYELEKPAKR